MSSETYFNIQVMGCAAAAYQINASRHCVRDVSTVLLEAQDNVRQIHMLNHVLGIRPAVPVPPAGAPHRSPRPRPVMSRPEAAATAAVAPSGDGAEETGMYRMDAIAPSSSQPSFDGDLMTGQISLSVTRSSRTFTPVSTMQRLAHAVRDDLPMDIVASNALDFVAAWRREDGKCAAQEDLIHECLTTGHTIEAAELEGRWRLEHLLINVTEQLHRFVLLSEYDKFIIFCVENEPVWRQAARHLQKENDARLNTTANIYARFLFEDTVAAEKTRMFQEAADYVVSLQIVEREQRSIARANAMTRRRRQSASQVVTPLPTPRESGTRRAETAPTAAAASNTTTATTRGSSGGNHGKGERRKEAAVPPAPQVKALTSVEVDNYREGWRAVMGHFTNGEKGGRTSLPAVTTSAAPPSKSSEDKRRLKSPPGRPEAAKSKGAAVPPSKEEKDRRTPLPPATKEEKKSHREKTSLSPSPPPSLPSRSKDDARGHRHSSPRDTAVQQSRQAAEEAAARRAKEEKKAKEARPVAVKAAPPRSSEEPREERRHHHHHREAKARS